MTNQSKIQNPISKITILVAFAAVVLILDQLTKWWVVANVARKGTAPLIEGFVRLRYTENRGAAFGFLQGWGGALSIAAIAIVIAILYSASKLGHGNRLGLVALGMITGGALGNLIDRLRLGYVVDFVDVYGPRIEINHYPYTFPVFNVADSGITVGAILLLASFIFTRDPDSQPEGQPSDGESHTTLPTRSVSKPPSAPKDPTPAGWAGLTVVLAGLLLMALRMSKERS